MLSVVIIFAFYLPGPSSKPSLPPKPKPKLHEQTCETTGPPPSATATLSSLSKPGDQEGETQSPNGKKRPPPPPAKSKPPRPYSIARLNSQKKPVVLSEALNLKQLMEKHSSHFPLRIMVVSGYSGETSQTTLSASDIYNIHFVKHQQVVAMQDNQGSRYIIPLNSSIQFGLLYSSTSSTSSDESSTIFQKVSDITVLKDMPKVVRATQAFKSPEEKSSVVENELFIICGTQKAAKFRGKKALKVYSMQMKTEKLLHADCEGAFSTNPALTRLYLSQITAHVPRLFPHKAVMYLGDSFNSPKEYVPSSLPASVVTLLELKTEKSLIASTDINPEAEELLDQENEVLLDIPLDDSLADVEIAVMEQQQHEDTEKLYENTRTIFENFNPAKIRSFRGTSSEMTRGTQSLFFTSLMEGSERVGLELEAPSAAYRQKNLVSSTPTSTASEVQPDQTYESIEEVKSKRGRYSKLNHSSQHQLQRDIRAEECLYEHVRVESAADKPVFHPVSSIESHTSFTGPPQKSPIAVRHFTPTQHEDKWHVNNHGPLGRAATLPMNRNMEALYDETDQEQTPVTSFPMKRKDDFQKISAQLEQVSLRVEHLEQELTAMKQLVEGRASVTPSADASSPRHEMNRNDLLYMNIAQVSEPNIVCRTYMMHTCCISIA